MSERGRYAPGAAYGAEVTRDGERWTLVLVRELRHAPERVWEALTEPEHLREWAPFDADRAMGTAGVTVRLTTVKAPVEQVAETTITRAEAPRVLEYRWGGNELRWELEPTGTGTRLRLWHNIDRRYIAMGAAGWHICLDVLDHELRGERVGRRVGMELMQDEGWQRLHAEYARQFGEGA